MPNYTYRRKKDGEVLGQVYLEISEVDEFEKLNPAVEIAIGAPLIHSGRGMKKPDPEFRQLLKKIKKNSPGSTINDF